MITRKEFESLYLDTITKKEYDRIINKINDRFGEIYIELNPAIKKHGWFDFDNCPYDYGGGKGVFRSFNI